MLLKTNGAEAAAPTHARVAARAEPVSRSAASHKPAAAPAAQQTRKATTRVIAARGIDRRRDDRQADRVDRVDLAVAAAFEIVRPERQAVVLERVAAGVVVLDLEVVVPPEALRQHEIVRLVAAREQAAAGEAPGDAAVEQEPGERHDGRHAAGEPCVWNLRAAWIRSTAARSVSAPTTNQTRRAKRPPSTVSAGHSSASQGRNGTTRTPLANSGRVTSASWSVMVRASPPPAQATACASPRAAPAIAAISDSACHPDGSRATRSGPAGPETTSRPPRVHHRARPATIPAARARALALDWRSLMRAAGTYAPQDTRLRRGYGAASP